MGGVTRHTDNNTKPGEMCVKQLTVRGLPAGQGIDVVRNLPDIFFGGRMLKSKHIFISCVILLCSTNIHSQGLNALTITEPSQSPAAPYRLFRTGNIWTFIKLETATGKMWQVQFDVEGDARSTVELNSRVLATGKQRNPGRFTLYPTSNIYNFILLDQVNGRTWQVQWAQEEANRAIIPIE
jgi:hypothetical protein